jgi:hypothetical protein
MNQDGMHSKFQGFVNQMCSFIQLHLHHYPNGPTQVRLINTLSSKMMLTWFAPLFKHQSPSFNNFKQSRNKYVPSLETYLTKNAHPLTNIIVQMC